MLLIVVFFAALRKSPGALTLLKILTAYLFTGGIILGWHPYVTNFISTGNPIYPIAGYSPVGKTPPPNDWPVFSLVQGQQPEQLKELPGPIKTLLALSSRVADPLHPEEKFQFFWQGSPNDFSRFIAPDLRLGAFGPFYALALIISLLGLLRIKKDPNSAKILTLCGVIILSSLLNPESWWGRYSPQLWMLPLLFAAACNYTKLLQGVSLSLLISSTVLLLVNSNAAYSDSKDVNNTLSKLEAFRGSTLPGSTERFYSNDIRLKKLNIKLSPPDNCPNKVYFAGSPSFVCLP